MNSNEAKSIQRTERKRVRTMNAQKRAAIKAWLKKFEISSHAYDYAWRDNFQNEIVFYADRVFEKHFISRPGFIRIDDDQLDNSYAYYIFEIPENER